MSGNYVSNNEMLPLRIPTEGLFGAETISLLTMALIRRDKTANSSNHWRS